MHNKYCLFPIRNQKIYEAYKRQLKAFWLPDELDFNKDRDDYEKLSVGEKQFINSVLAFFAQADGIVGENLALRFYNDTDLPEARLYYGLQLAMEGVHSETYSLLIDSYIKDPIYRDHLFNAIETMPCVAKKADWALKWINNGTFAQRLVAFSIVEGIFFSGSFCAIYWLRSRGLMPGLSTANDYIARDEGQHCEFAVLLYKEMNLFLPQADFLDMIKQAVAIEKNFITEAIPVSLIGMNNALMSQYIEYVADRLLQRFGLPKTYNAENPFEFMRMIDVENKTNFFEARPTEYSKMDLGALDFNADF